MNLQNFLPLNVLLLEPHIKLTTDLWSDYNLVRQCKYSSQGCLTWKIGGESKSPSLLLFILGQVSHIQVPVVSPIDGTAMALVPPIHNLIGGERSLGHHISEDVLQFLIDLIQ